MGLALEFWRFLSPAPDPRSEREIRGDIEEELAFHLEQRERELVARGVPPAQARQQALRRFGDVDHIRAECRQVQLGGRIMLQRITLLAVVMLLAAVVGLSFQNVASQRVSNAEMQALRAQLSQLTQSLSARETSRTPEDATRQLQEIAQGLQASPWFLGAFQSQNSGTQTKSTPSLEATTLEQWTARFAQAVGAPEASEQVAFELRRNCSPARVAQLLQPIWATLPTAQRLDLLNVLIGGSDESLVRRVVHLAASDADPVLAQHGFELWSQLAFVSLRPDQRAEYLAWHAANAELSLYEIVEKSAPALIEELLAQPGWTELCERFAQPLNGIGEASVIADVNASLLIEAGALRLIQAWSRDPNPRGRVAAAYWMAAVEVDCVTLRMLLLPMLEPTQPRDPRLLPAVCEALQLRQCSWSWEVLLPELRRAAEVAEPQRALLEPLARALASQEAQSVVPGILACLCRSDSSAVAESLGRLALEPLTGVSYEPGHDATWWRNWWSIYRSNYPQLPGDSQALPMHR